MRQPAFDVFVKFLKEKKGRTTSAIARVLSDHLTGILEGDECNLADAFLNGSIHNWEDVVEISQIVEPCCHNLPKDDHPELDHKESAESIQ